MRRKFMLAALLVAVLSAGVAALAGETKSDAKEQTLCPVMNSKVNRSLYVDAKGYRIYVCCPGCKAKVKADPDKYIQQLQAAGVQLEKTPVEDGKQETR